MAKKGQHLSEETKAKIRAKLLGRRCCMKSEFARGMTPWNKGLKGIHMSPATEFKKGNRPANYMGGMKLSQDGIYVKGKGRYSYQKDGKQIIVGKYEQLARVKYRKAFGKFPKNMIIFHKDGNILNNEIDNLELISRGELLKRNQYHNKKNCCICGKEFLARCNKCKTCSKKCYEENCRNLARIYRQKNRIKHNEYQQKWRMKQRNKEIKY